MGIVPCLGRASLLGIGIMALINSAFASGNVSTGSMIFGLLMLCLHDWLVRMPKQGREG